MHWITVGQWRMCSDFASTNMEADTRFSPPVSKEDVAPLAESVEQTLGSLARHCVQTCDSVAIKCKEAYTDLAQLCEQANSTASSAIRHIEKQASQCEQENKLASSLSGRAGPTAEHPGVECDSLQWDMVQKRMKRYCLKRVKPYAAKNTQRAHLRRTWPSNQDLVADDVTDHFAKYG